MGCVEPPFFYLPYKMRRGNIVINPVTHIHDKRFGSKQFFVPYMDNPHTTGEITIYQGGSQDELPTEGCEYRIYRKITHNDGSFEYISVDQNGAFDESETQPMFKNKQTFNLPTGTYYYKEFISAEGDILHFKPVKFVVTNADVGATEPREIIIDHEPKLAKCYIKYKETIDTFKFEADDVSGKNPTSPPNGHGYWGYTATSFSGGIELLKDYSTSDFLIGTTDDNESVKYYFYPTNGSGDVDEQVCMSNPVHKIVPEIYEIKYMGRDYSNLLNTKPSLNEEERHIFYNDSGNISGTTPWGSYIQYYFNNFTRIKLDNGTRSNPDLYIGDVLVSTGHVMLYSEYQRFGKLRDEDTDYLYFGESYSSGTGNQNNQTEIYQGYVVVSSNLLIHRGGNPFTDFIYNYIPQKNVEVKDKCDTYVSGGIYLLGMKTPKYKYKLKKIIYDGNDSYWYNIDKTQGTEEFFCEKHARMETRYFIKDNEIEPPNVVETTESVMEYGGNTALGYACAEDCGGAAMWACKLITSEDPDTEGGFQPRYTAPDTPLYFTITLYEKGDEYCTVPRYYDAQDGLLFPQISPHERKQEECMTVYNLLDAHKGYERACNVATVFVRQTRDNYASWFGATEPTDWDDDNGEN